ncbi:von Ebner gland protein 1-like [Thomomys bottae]
MKTLLLSFSLGLAAVLQAQTLPTVGEDEKEDLGTWYLKAVTSEKEIPELKQWSVSVTPMNVEILEGGSLKISFTLGIAGHCREISSTMQESEEPGTYTAYGGRHVEQIVRSSVEDHYIFYGVADVHGHQVRTAKLVGRDPAINLEALKDFENVTRARGLSSETLVIPTQRETCSPGAD